jgi:hypoxia up-regulated 1
VENLTGDDVDLKVPVSRDQIEELCKDLLEKSMVPITKALEMSGLAKEIVNEILMFGGLTRTPQIKAKLEAEGFSLLANINTDEAAAIGASYRAADLSSAFRVKPFGIKNASPLQIQVEFDREVTDEETGEKRMKHSKRILFGVGATYPQKKILTFNRYTDDFHFEVNYGDITEYKHFTSEAEAEYYKNMSNLMKIKIEGVNKALTDNEKKSSKGIKVHFKVDDSGIFTYTKVESLFEEDVLIPKPEKKEPTEEEKKEGIILLLHTNNNCCEEEKAKEECSMSTHNVFQA